MTAAAIREHFRHRTRSKQPFALAWNASVLTHDLETGKSRTEFHGKWINQPTTHRGVVRWSPIIAEFIGDGGAFSLADSPLQLSSPQQATGQFEVTNSLCWDIFEKKKIGEKSASMSITHPGARPVDGVILDGRPWQVVYPDALGDGVDIVYGLWHARAPRAEVVYVIRREPAGDGEVVAIEKNVRLQSGLSFNNHQPNERFTLHGEGGRIALNSDPKRGFGIRPAKAWYYDAAGDQHTFDISLVIEPGPRGSVTVRKIVPRALIREALAARPGGELRVDTTSTFYPDADAETTSVDGYTFYDGGTTGVVWSTARAANGTTAADSGTSAGVLWISATTATAGRYRYVNRGHFLFDTSSIPDTDTVSAWECDLWGNGKTTTLGVSPFAGLYSTNPASNTAIVAADHQTVGSTLLSGSIAFSALSTAGYNTFTGSNMSVISKTGITKLAIREKTYDADGGTPPWVSGAVNSFSVRMADYAGTSSDPLLTVEHSAAASGKPVFANTYRRLRT